MHFKLLAILVFIATSTEAHPRESNHHLPATRIVDKQHYAEFSIQGAKRVMQTNGIPKHVVGEFPNRGNPHTITPQSQRYEWTTFPKLAQWITPIDRHLFGVALNGVPFDPETAEFFRGDPHSKWKLEAMTTRMARALDANHAHVQPSGAYHYHGLPTALISELEEPFPTMTLVGWSADGFPIYSLYGYKNSINSNSPLVELRASYRIRKGNRPSGGNVPQGPYNGDYTLDWEYVEDSGDLDACNGRYGVTPEFPEGIYYYVITSGYPFIPRSFMGTPDQSFLNRSTVQNQPKRSFTDKDRQMRKVSPLQPKGH